MPILPALEPVLLHAAPVIATQQVIAPPPVMVPCYAAPPIVYVVQVPGAGPTPPVSECSSEENVQVCTVERLGQQLEVDQKDDILILPLSPDPVLEQPVVSEVSTRSVETMVTPSNLGVNLPDRRKRKSRKRKRRNNNNNDNSSENMDCNDEDDTQEAPLTKTVSLFDRQQPGS